MNNIITTPVSAKNRQTEIGKFLEHFFHLFESKWLNRYTIR